MEGLIFTNEELWQRYPNEWCLMRVVERDGLFVSKAELFNHNPSKGMILDEARGMRATGIDVFVTCTFDTLEDAVAIMKFDNELVSKEYVTPAEYAEMFNYYHGLLYREFDMNESGE